MFTKEKLEDEIIAFAAAHGNFELGHLDDIDYEVELTRILAIGNALASIKSAEANVEKVTKRLSRNISKNFPGIIPPQDYL